MTVSVVRVTFSQSLIDRSQVQVDSIMQEELRWLSCLYDIIHISLRDATLHCKKYPYIHGYFVENFRYFNKTVPYMFVFVNRRNTEKRAHGSVKI